MTPWQFMYVSILVSGLLIVTESLLLRGLKEYVSSIFKGNKNKYIGEDTIKDLPMKVPALWPLDCIEQKAQRSWSSMVRGLNLDAITEMLPWEIKLPCLATKFTNFEIFNGFLDALEAIVMPCKKRRPSEALCQPNATFEGDALKMESDHPKEWPCFQQSLNAREFYDELNKLYKLLNPCAPHAPKLNLESKDPSELKDDENVGLWVNALWWFWWYFLSNEIVLHLARRDQGDLEAAAYQDVLVFGNAFDPRKPTKILIEGYVNPQGKSMNRQLKKAYLKNAELDAIRNAGDEEYFPNIITVDWSRLSYKLYAIKRSRVIVVAKGIVALVKRLVQQYGITCGSIHLIGHSLGAHIAGVAGNLISTDENYVCKLQNGNGTKSALSHKKEQLGRITGLDPAGPLFTTTAKKWRLGRYSAEFVDVIHTSDYAFGDAAKKGHVDFYVNSGVPIQPGCRFTELLCSNYRAIYYYRESIRRPNAFKARQCTTMIAFKLGYCDEHHTAIMGEKALKSSRGSYYLNTASHYPFGLGDRGI